MNRAADEIAKIEHELAMLRERYAIFQRGAEWVRRTLIAACVVVMGLVVWTLVLGRSSSARSLLSSYARSSWCRPCPTATLA